MITIVTDSTAYFSENEAAELGIEIVPTKYIVNGRILFESFSDKNGDYTDIINLDKNGAFTEQTSVSVFRSIFDSLVRRGSKVLCILISSRLSGSYHNARAAAKDMENVEVVDSLLAAGGLKILVEKLKKLAEETEDLKTLVKKAEQLRENIGIVFSLENMESLKRNSKRLGFVRQSIGTALNIRPVLRCENGAVISEGTVRGFREQIKKLTECIPSDAVEIVVNCNGDIKNFEMLKAVLNEKFKNSRIMYDSIGPVLFIYLGKGGLVISYSK